MLLAESSRQGTVIYGHPSAFARPVAEFFSVCNERTQLPVVRQWLTQHGLGGMAITNVKDMHMAALYDNKAARVKRNSDYVCPGCCKRK